MIIEKLGDKYFGYLSKKVSSKDYIHIATLPNDKILHTITKNITLSYTALIFLISGLTVVPSIIFGIKYYTVMDSFEYYFYFFSLIILGVLVEIIALYWINLKAVHLLAVLMNYEKDSNDSDIPIEYQTRNILIRTALEMPDPIIEFLGIDLSKNIDKKKLAILTFLYKAKFILTTLILKIVIRQFFPRFALRYGVDWVSIFVTSFWNGILLL